MKNRKFIVGIAGLSILLVAVLVGIGILIRHKNPSAAGATGSLSATPRLPADTVAVVAGDPISVAEFQANVRIRNIVYLQQFKQMALTIGDDPSTRQQYQSALDNLGTTIQEYLIEDRLCRQEAARRDISVSRQEIESYMQTQNAQYQETMGYYAQYQITENDLLRTVDSQLIRDKVQAAVLADASAVPAELETIWARQIRVSSEKTAREIIKKLSQGADFAALAKQYSQDASTREAGGDLGWFSRDQAVAEFAQAAFSLKNVNDITQQPVKTVLGYNVIQLLGRKSQPFASDTDKFNYWLGLQKRAVTVIRASDAVVKSFMPALYPLPVAQGTATSTPAP